MSHFNIGNTEDFKKVKGGLNEGVKQESGILSSGTHKIKVDIVYTDTNTNSGTVHGVLRGHTVDTGKAFEISEVIQFSTAEGGAVTRKNRDGRVQISQGFTLLNTLAVLAIGKELNELEMKKITVPDILNFTTQSKEPAKRNTFPELVGKEVTLAGIEKFTDQRKGSKYYNHVFSVSYLGNGDGFTLKELKDDIKTPTFLASYAADLEPNFILDKRITSKPVNAQGNTVNSSSTVPNTQQKEF